jgi:hypothetical protein
MSWRPDTTQRQAAAVESVSRIAMTVASDNDWPDSDWHIGQRDHLHALGVIVAAFNILEFRLFVLFLRFMKADTRLVSRIFAQLRNL